MKEQMTRDITINGSLSTTGVVVWCSKHLQTHQECLEGLPLLKQPNNKSVEALKLVKLSFPDVGSSCPYGPYKSSVHQSIGSG